MEVREISTSETKPFILTMHYAQRMPSISYAFGLFNNNELIGVVTFGKPASNPLCIGVCGAEYSSKVFELNRLVLLPNAPTNSASKLVGGALKMLKPSNLIIVSYADTAMEHIGFVYQATNWLYTGKTASRTDKYAPLGKHSRHYDKQAEEVYRVVRSAKHRYVYFAGDKTFRKQAHANLRYPIMKYVKGESKHYELGTRITRLLKDVKTGEIFKESDRNDS